MQIAAAGLPEPIRQARIIPGRRFSFDFCWTAQRLTVEVQGGLFLPRGGHTTGMGVSRDCEKSAMALLEGYRPLAVTAAMVRDGRALAWIETLLRRSGGH